MLLKSLLFAMLLSDAASEEPRPSPSPVIEPAARAAVSNQFNPSRFPRPFPASRDEPFSNVSRRVSSDEPKP